jgi:hypothetical protein
LSKLLALCLLGAGGPGASALREFLPCPFGLFGLFVIFTVARHDLLYLILASPSITFTVMRNAWHRLSSYSKLHTWTTLIGAQLALLHAWHSATPSFYKYSKQIYNIRFHRLLEMDRVSMRPISRITPQNYQLKIKYYGV